MAFWRIAYSMSTWRRVGYAVAAPPTCVVCLVLAAAGRARVAAPYQRRLGRGLLGLPPGGGSPPAVRGVRVFAGSIAGLLTGIVCWTVLQYLAFFLFINLGFPLRGYLSFGSRSGVAVPWWGIHRISSSGDVWASHYANSWGGPTLAGAWAVHAGLALVTLGPVLLWAVRGLTWLQGTWALALLGDRAGAADIHEGSDQPAAAR